MQRNPKSSIPNCISVNRMVRTGSDLADDYNSFFVNAGAPDVSADYINKYMPPRTASSFEFKSVTVADVKRICLDLRDNAAPGSDGISAKPFRVTVQAIMNPLIHIINHYNYRCLCRSLKKGPCYSNLEGRQEGRIGQL